MRRGRSATGSSTRTWISVDQSRLESELLAALSAHAPGEALIIVRTKEEATRLLRRVPPGIAVLTLARFLGRAGPAAIEQEDLLPEAAVRWLVDAGVPPVYSGVAREHMVGTLLEAILALEANNVRPPYPGEPTRDIEGVLESAHKSVLHGLATHAERGRFARLQQVSLARDGVGTETAWPRLQHASFFGIDTLSPAEREAIAQVTEDVPQVSWYVLARAPGDPDHPGLELADPLVRWLADRGEIEVLAPGATRRERASLLARLFSDAPLAREPLPGVAVARPPDFRAEVRTALARVRGLLEEGVAPERIGIIVPRLERYAATLVDAFALHGVPAAVSYHGALRESSVGSLLSGVLRALDSGLERDAVLDVLAHPLARPALPPPAEEEPAGPDFLVADIVEALLHEYGLHPRGLHGPGGWSVALERIAKMRARERGRSLGALERRQLAGARAVLERLASLAELADAPGFLEGLRAFLEEIALPRMALAGARRAADPAAAAAAYRGVISLLDEADLAFRCASPAGHPVEAARDLLRRGLKEREIPLPADPDEGVQVIAWRNARGRVFEHVIVLGATQDALPGRGARDAVEALLAPRFGKLEHLDEVLEARRILHALALSTEGSLLFMAPAREQDDPLVLSVLVEEMRGSFLLEEAPEPAERAWTPLEAAQLAGRTRRPLAAPPVQGRAARALVAARAAGIVGPYTGHVPSDLLATNPGALPLSRGAGFSTSAVSDFAACAFRAFATRGLGIRARTVRGPDVDGMEKGDLVHRIIETFLRAALAQTTPYRLAPEGVAEAERRMYDIAAAEIEWRRRGISWDALAETLLGGLRVAGNPHRGAPRGLLARFLDDLAAFGAGEGVIGAEVPFGGAQGEKAEEGSGPRVPFVTPAETVELRGKVDRLDRVRAASGFGVRVVDLKTGDPPHRRLVDGGVDFQLPFYVQAARVLAPGLPVVEAAYHQLKRPRAAETGYRRGARYTLQGAVGDEEDLFARTPERVAAILAAERDGRFPLTLLSDDEAKCGFCELRRGCGLRTELFAVRREAARRARREGLGDFGYVADRVIEGTIGDEEEGGA